MARGVYLVCLVRLRRFCTGSDANQIITETNAHNVQHMALMKIKTFGSFDKWSAKKTMEDKQMQSNLADSLDSSNVCIGSAYIFCR